MPIFFLLPKRCEDSGKTAASFVPEIELIAKPRLFRGQEVIPGAVNFRAVSLVSSFTFHLCRAFSS
jgi:hypothetical protein